MSNERNYGVDCLRYFLMFMVCVLHVLGLGGILSSTAKGSLQYTVFWLIEIICFCAVNSFAFISGYVAKDNRDSNCSKLVRMWFQVIFYSLFLTLIIKPLGVGEIGGV